MKGRLYFGYKDNFMGDYAAGNDAVMELIISKDHYPCVIYMREQGKPIGKVGLDMREERVEWYLRTDTHKDPICKDNCLDACVDFNTKAMEKINEQR